MTEKWISKDKTRSLNTVGTLFLCLQLFHGLMFSLFVMYLKKLRASDWLKTSTFSWNTSANYKYRARFQNFVCLDFLRFCVILCITAKHTCPTGSAILSSSKNLLELIYTKLHQYYVMVRVGKTCGRGLEYSRQRKQFFPMRTYLGWWITFLFFSKTSRIPVKRTRII